MGEIFYSFGWTLPNFLKKIACLFNPNWHEAGRIYPPYNVWIGFCQLNFYQKFQTFLELNIEINRKFDTLPSSLSLTKLAPRWR